MYDNSLPRSLKKLAKSGHTVNRLHILHLSRVSGWDESFDGFVYECAKYFASVYLIVFCFSKRKRKLSELEQQHADLTAKKTTLADTLAAATKGKEDTVASLLAHWYMFLSISHLGRVTARPSWRRSPRSRQHRPP